MKNILFIAFFGLVTTLSTFAQDLDSYQYVRVPERFEFLKEDNQYQLNALTAFLLEKYGFSALYQEPDPEGVDVCKILQADVNNESGLFRSKLYVSFRNCKDEIVFTSKVGESRKKDFKISYQEALRVAFESIEDLEHVYVGETELPISAVKASSGEENEKERQSISTEPMEVEHNLPDTMVNTDNSKEGIYSNGAQNYELKKAGKGFYLFREGETERYARLVPTAGGSTFLYASEKIQGTAHFDQNGNLVVEYLDESSGHLITIVYHLVQ